MKRSREPAETIEAMGPYLRSLGITRVARQTGLDRTGMPCFSCIRPDATTLTVSQGKGLTEDQARVSAIMEAAEFAVAESPLVASILASPLELEERGEAYFVPYRLMPMGLGLSRKTSIHWLKGELAFSRRSMLVPMAAVRLAPRQTELPGICQTTNGLASGNDLEEALVAALCELIERDANTIWSLRDPGQRTGSAVSTSSFDDPEVRWLAKRLKAEAIELRLFDQMSDCSTPTFMAAIGTFGGAGTRYQVAAGFGTHLDPVHAVLRAITEALQSRITAIASTRDDLMASSFSETIRADDLAIFRAPQESSLRAKFKRGTPSTAINILSQLQSRLEG